jgi:23S rRNA pseudouridine2457 synthase
LKYLLFNKPYHVVCQFSESEDGAPTLASYIPVPDIYPAGRLDHDSEGLVLLTDDGGLQHRLTDPKFGHRRTYWAQVEGVPTPDALRRLEAGVLLRGFKTRYRTRPATARILDPLPELWPRNPPIRYRANIPDAWIELVLEEGRNRQVRRMTANVGFPTLRLVRSAIGDLTIEGLQPGRYRELTAVELARLMRFRDSPLRVWSPF